MTTYNKQANGSFLSCGCGGAPKEQPAIPEGSVQVFIQDNAFKTGPVTGIQYGIQPVYNCLDIDERDANVWRLEGYATDPRPSHSYRLTRTGRVMPPE